MDVAPGSPVGEEASPVYVKTDIQALLAAAQLRMSAHLRDPDATPITIHDVVKIQAPMVRCSRPPFRQLCRLWGTDISYTHMIMAESFVQSHFARVSDFALYEGEDKLICQLAGKDGPTVGMAALLVSKYCDAIDLNCGCPQKWVMKEGIGAALLESPELVADMVKNVRNIAGVPCVIKMRVKEDIAKSIDFARQVEAAGASWITVHGRTPTDTPGCDVRHASIATIREHVSIPVVANGSVECVSSAISTATMCGVGAVMSARGLLTNPTCFYTAGPAELLTYCVSEGATTPRIAPAELPEVLKHLCPVEAVSDFLRLATICDLPLKATMHHALLMTDHYLTPSERRFLSLVRSNVALLEGLRQSGLYTDHGKVAL